METIHRDLGSSKVSEAAIITTEAKRKDAGIWTVYCVWQGMFAFASMLSDFRNVIQDNHKTKSLIILKRAIPVLSLVALNHNPHLHHCTAPEIFLFILPQPVLVIST